MLWHIQYLIGLIVCKQLQFLSMRLKNVANLDLEWETLVKVGERITAQICSSEIMWIGGVTSLFHYIAVLKIRTFLLVHQMIEYLQLF